MNFCRIFPQIEFFATSNIDGFSAHLPMIYSSSPCTSCVCVGVRVCVYTLINLLNTAGAGADTAAIPQRLSLIYSSCRLADAAPTSDTKCTLFHTYYSRCRASHSTNPYSCELILVWVVSLWFTLQRIERMPLAHRAAVEKLRNYKNAT